LERNFSCGCLIRKQTLPVLSLEKEFRNRLKAAVEAGPRKRVLGEKVSEGGLSKILSGAVANPRLFTIKAIADEAGVTVGSLLGEKGFEPSTADREMATQAIVHLRSIASWIEDLFHRSTPSPTEPPANESARIISAVMRMDQQTREAFFRELAARDEFAALKIKE